MVVNRDDNEALGRRWSRIAMSASVHKTPDIFP